MINARNTLGTSGYGSRRALLFGIALAITALALLARHGVAQEPEAFDLLGRVVDANSGQPLDGAWVAVTGTQWGSITNEEGRFRIAHVEAGRIALTIERLGYETLEWVGEVSGDDGLLRIDLNAQPIVLEGLQVVTDRFRARRNAVATSVFAYDSGELASGNERSALEFIRYRAGVALVGCNGRLGNTCVFVRGGAVEPVIYVDEVRVLGGLDYLASFAPWDFYMVEIYGRGRHIRAYTPQFMKRAAERRLRPIALLF
jgi:carboxypeptidase-like protein